MKSESYHHTTYANTIRWFPKEGYCVGPLGLSGHLQLSLLFGIFSTKLRIVIFISSVMDDLWWWLWAYFRMKFNAIFQVVFKLGTCFYNFFSITFKLKNLHLWNKPNIFLKFLPNRSIYELLPLKLPFPLSKKSFPGPWNWGLELLEYDIWHTGVIQ